MIPHQTPAHSRFETSTQTHAITEHDLCRYEAHIQTPTGSQRSAAAVAPAQGPFLAAFAAIARGAVVDTTRGGVAIEDLSPGDRVVTASGRVERLVWCGSVTIEPAQLDPEARYLRIPVDAFGPGRPTTDTVLGPAAMQVSRNPDLCAPLRASAVLLPLAEHADDGAKIPITPTVPVTFYQIGFARQCGVIVGGVEIASLTPRQPGLHQLSPSLRSAYLSLFPQYSQIEAAGRPMGPTLGSHNRDGLAA